MFTSIYPYSGQVLARYEPLPQNVLSSVIARSEEDFAKWSRLDLADRIGVIESFKSNFEAAKDQLASTITWEMGKPLVQAKAEVDKCIWLLDHYLNESPGYLEPEQLDLDDIHVTLRKDPIGCIFGIMPWNFPLWQTFRYAIPTLLAGNTVLLKPAPNVCGVSMHLGEIFHSSSDLHGIFQVVPIEIDLVEHIIAHPAVQGVTLTGSDRAGSSVASLAGKYLKKCVMELGGSDPFIVMGDAEIPAAANAFIQSRMNNTGQTCIAAKRAIVQSGIQQDFSEAVLDEISRLKVGDPFEDGVQLSCIAREDLSVNLQKQIERARQSGALELLSGGRRGDTNVFDPVVFAEPDRDSVLWKEEIFGPVVSIASFDTVEHAVALANDTKYGLGASIWSNDLELANNVAARVNAGSIHINRMVSSDPRVPFGGVGISGFGRELGREGMMEFVNLKSVTSSHAT